MNPQNPGSFMGGNGQGSALLRLMQLRGIGVSPQMQNANTQNPQAVTPAPPPTGVGGPPNIMGAPPQGDTNMGQNNPVAPPPVAPPPVAPTTPDDNLALAMQALSSYIKAHGEAHMAKHGVNESKARASAIAAQNRPQGGQ